ncbi:MAG: glycosyltransferase [Gemmatimonadetes bacterium]|nr:glycosyltransferase [Gemmatimonadota bacterium]
MSATTEPAGPGAGADVLGRGPVAAFPEAAAASSLTELARLPTRPLVAPDPDQAPPAGDVEVSVVIPCRNEAAAIGGCVREARAALERCGYPGEVVVCDNGSTDGSPERACREGARVVHQPIRGYGAACLRGLEAAQGRYLVLADGDGTYDLSVINRFVEPLRAGYDVVLGTRRNGRILADAMRAAHRHLLEPIQTWLSRRFFRFRVSDVRCGVRSIRREALSRLRLGATGMEFASEFLVEVARERLKTVEVPVSFRPRRSGEPRRSVGDGWRVARHLLLLSPTRLFLGPGLLLLILGLALEFALLPGPIRLPAFNVDYHFMFVGGALAILGMQLVLLGIYAKTYALVHDPEFADPWIRRFHLRYTLERGVALGGLLFGAGFIIDVGILAHWAVRGFGVLFAVRPAVLALTFMVLGAEIVFAAFFLSLLRAPAFGRV